MKKTLPNNVIDLSELQQGMPALTSALGEAMAQAGAVCFEEQEHERGVTLKLNGDYQSAFKVYWPDVTDQMKRTWNDEEFTTEQGAYGLAILTIRELENYTVVERSRKGTGFDYWLGDSNDLLFQKKARLEVSGIRRRPGAVATRTKKKLGQTSKSDSLGIPAYIAIVEFSRPSAQVVKK